MSMNRHWLYGLVFALLLAPGTALAALEVEFSSLPLFAEAGLLPGDAFEQTVVVTNTGANVETVEFDFTNVIDGPLADAVELAVDDGTTVWVDDTFSELFDAGPFALGTLEPNASTSYAFTAAMSPTAPNPLQGEQFGFDIRIGFVAGPQFTDRPRSATGGGGTRTLSLFNERARVESGSGGAFIAWDSTRPASSYLVCGERSAGPYTLTESAPLFGYQFSITETDTTSRQHAQALTELAPGEYECRPAGRESARDGFTIGDAVRFTVPVPPAGQVAGISTSLSEADIRQQLAAILQERPRGSVLGTGTKGAGNITYEAFRAEMDELMANRAPETEVDTLALAPVPETEPQRNAAAVSAAGQGSGWLTWVFGALLVPLLGWLVWRTMTIY